MKWAIELLLDYVRRLLALGAAGQDLTFEQIAKDLVHFSEVLKQLSIDQRAARAVVDFHNLGPGDSRNVQ